jgi:hypothetical protein
MSNTEKILEKAQVIWEDSLTNPIELMSPDSVYSDWYALNYQRLRVVMDAIRKRGFASGVFNALSAVGMDERKQKMQRFINGDGI